MAFIFLSYRSGDDDDYVETLMEYVLADARTLERPAETTEVFSSSGDWSAATIDALARCTVFLAVHSDRYRLTERCGREWQAFLDRLDRHESATGRRPRAIIPIRWGAGVEAASLPGGGFVDPLALGEDARALTRLSVNRARYRALVGRIATHAIAVSRADPVPPAAGPLAYAAVRNAFQAAAEPEVRFLVPGGEPSAMARIAQAVATEQHYRSEVVDDPERIHELLAPDRAETGVVMVLDSWGVRRAEFRDVRATATVIPLGNAGPRFGPDRLSAEVSEILETARNLSFRSAAVRRTAPGRPWMSRPILDAP